MLSKNVHRPLSRFSRVARFVVACFLNTLFVGFCWIFFRSDSFTVAGQVIVGIFTWQDGIVQIYSWVIVALIVVFAGTIAVIVKNRSLQDIDGYYPLLDLSKFRYMVLFLVVVGLIAGLAYTGANPFIYFQF